MVDLDNPQSPLCFFLKNAGELSSAALLDENTQWTWLELLESAASLAAVLQSSGVAAGARVAYLTNDNAEGFTILLGIWLAGAVAAPLNISLPAHSIKRILDKLDPALIVLGKTAAQPEVEMVAYRVGANSIEKPFDISAVSVEPESPALILFTSGTTGQPKGVVSSHAAVASNALSTSRVLGVTSDDRILINTPHYYTSAIIHLLTMAAQGAGLAIKQGFLFSDTFCKSMQELGCTCFGGAPTHLVRILDNDPPFKPDRLRFFMTSGDHLPDHVALKAKAIFPGVEIYRAYGLSEVAGRLCILPPHQLEEKPGSVGIPLEGMTVSVLDEDGKAAVPGESGEVYVSGHMLSKEYFRDPANTETLLAPCGFRTGDIGKLDEDGFLYLLGRKDDVFKSGGEKVSALQVQQAIAALGVVDDVSVVSAKDELLGHVPKVYYVSADGQDVDKMAVVRALRKTLPNTHIPRTFERVNIIPRTGSGKVVKSKLPGMSEGKGA